MATVKYLLKGSNSPCTIYVRLKDGSAIDFTISTKLTINPKYWSNQKKWIKHVASFRDKQNIEQSLRDLENYIHEERNRRLSEGLPLNKEWFKNLIEKYHGGLNNDNNELLITQMIQYKESLPNRVRNGIKGVSSGTIRNYNTTISRLLKFEAHMSHQLRLLDIDLSFHEKYLKFAHSILGLSVNSVGKDIKQIKTVCLNAKDHGMKINEQVESRKFTAPSEPTVFTTLNEVELNMLFEYKGKNYLENARDWLIIGCWTGCRVGDLMELSDDNIINHTNGKKLIQYTQSKTNKLVNVPMHWQIEAIVARLGGFPRPISPAKFNLYIKELCKNVGMTYTVQGSRQNPITHKKEVGTFEKWELIKSHICRRSFATNHYNRMANKKIMAVTGHATEKMLLNYIGETDTDHVDDFFELWETTNQNSTVNKMHG